ncbi:7753_t:CDS:2 [Entrophospora sp. SA101]|nr:7753_t:CDS:2 [Entrophospora sp. SA101]
MGILCSTLSESSCKLFHGNWMESEEVLGKITTGVIEVLFIYGGKIMFDEEEKEPLVIFECLMAADELLLDEFIDYTQTLLLNKHIQWLKDNLPIIFRITFNTNALKKLQDFCLDRIRKYPNLLFDSDEFLLLPEDCLEQLLKDDELEMEEMPFKKSLGEFYDTMEKFHLPITSNNAVTNSSPLTTKEFTSSLTIYRPKNLTILPYRGAIISTIMSVHHAITIASWIDKMDLTSNNNGGVDNHNTNNIATTSTRIVESDHKYALNYWRSIGPSFGKFDLLMENNIIKFKHRSYHPNIMPIDNGYARIEDYEVFQVVRKATVLSPSSSTIINANSTSTDNII